MIFCQTQLLFIKSTFKTGLFCCQVLLENVGANGLVWNFEKKLKLHLQCEWGPRISNCMETFISCKLLAAK